MFVYQFIEKNKTYKSPDDKKFPNDWKAGNVTIETTSKWSDL